jgi:iron complex outermembrane recepter protein
MSLFFMLMVFAIPQFAQAQSFDLDEFETDIQGGIKEEREKEEKELQQKTTPSENNDSDEERIQVTGSHIKRSSMEGVSPIFVLDRAALERSGHNSVSDVLRDMGQSSFGGAREQSGSTAAGSSSVNLRGLGANKTLVLLNGKRLPMDAVTGAVDLNLIPMAAVQRIEVLVDGASATYGSDALGGVVNIITYRDFNGTQLHAQRSFTKFNGGEMQEVNGITGTATAKSSQVTVISYRENNSFLSKDRPWTDNGISPTGSPGSFRDGSGKWKPDPTCPTDQIESIGNGNNVCNFRFSDFSTELPELKQLSLMSLFEYETDHDFTVFGRVSGSRKLVNWQFAPAPGSFKIPAATAANLGLGDAYTGGDIMARYRTVELGNRVQDVETTSYGYQLGFKGELISSWDWELTYDYNRVRNISIGVSGYALQAKLEELIASGKFNPFGAQGKKGDISSAIYQPWQSSVSENNMTELKFTGELFNLPHGAVGLAVGAMMTHERFSDETDKLSEAGQVFSSAGSSGGGSRETSSIYAESVFPILKGMELQLAGRYDNFSDFGSTTNPKVGIKWDITPTIMLRASAGTGFKAPSMNDLYAAKSQGYQTFIDQVACKREQEQTPGDTPSCTPKQWLVKSGGNEDLEEERSKSYNLGLLFQPTKKIVFGGDLWMTNVTNVVGIDYEMLTLAESQGVNLDQYGVNVRRDADGYIDDENGINAPLLNLAQQQVSGIDLNASARFDSGITLQTNHSILFYFKEEGFPGTGLRDRLRENGRPAWRNTTTISYDLKKNTFNLIAKTIGEQEKAVKAEGNLPTYTEFDFAYNRQFFEKTTLIIGIQNLFGTTPPLDRSNPNTPLNASLYNPRGQLAYIGLKQGF